MAQTCNYKGPDKEIWLEGIETACLICQNESPYDVFWNDNGRIFYICKNCEYIIKGLYKDVVFQESENKGLSIDEIVKCDLDKMQKIIEMRNKNKMYKYAVCAGIIDYFEPSFTMQQILSDDDLKKDYEIKISQINEYIFGLENEKPHTIRFFSLPNFDYSHMEIYAIAKISNNGSTYVFGDDPEVLEFLTRGNGVNKINNI